jgi:phospholipid/cholesterol/gamma-HCH transport system substrate-binding protein
MSAASKGFLAMSQKMAETSMGAVLLLLGVFALYTVHASSQITTTAGYTVSVRFNKVGGLGEGNAVRIAGLQVGTIVSQKLDPETYDAVLELTVRSDVKLPKDTEAEVSSDGLLGGKFILLTPGKSKEMIPPGGKIEKAKGVVALEELVGRMIFSTAQSN